VDLLASGDQRPSPPEPPAWARRFRRLWRHRGARVGAVVLAAAAALVVLQLTVDPQPRPRAARPPVSAAPTTVTRATPPFDQLPGRTPIPAPAQTGDLLSGPLPVIGGPDRPRALRVAAMIVGRFCADLSRYTLELEPDTNVAAHADDFHHLGVLVTDRELTDSGPAMRLTLDWDHRAYRWTGPLTLLNGC
jgi:hypothetical protein